MSAPPIVYVSCAESKEIHSFRLDAESGALNPLEVVAVPGTDEPSPSNMPLALGPGGQTLYAALRTAPFPVTAFAVDPASSRLPAAARRRCRHRWPISLWVAAAAC
jgi:6-phosphogluconolactonase